MACKRCKKTVYGVFVTYTESGVIALLKLFHRQEQAQAFADLQSNTLDTNIFTIAVQELPVEA
jgi:hypothetical protein